MVAPFPRYFNVGARVSSAVPPGFLAQNLSGDGLRIRWDVMLTNKPTPDKATITITNLSKTVRLLLQELVNLSTVSILLEIGWDNVVQVLYGGAVWNLEPTRVVGTEVETVIQCGAGQDAYRDSMATQNFNGATLGVLLDLLITSPASTDGFGGLGLIYDPASKAIVEAAVAATPVALQNITCDGNVRDIVNDFMATLGLTWTIQNGVFFAIQGGIITTPEVPLISPFTGLVSWSPEAESGVRFQALARPDVVPGRLLVLQDSLGVPIGGSATWRVETARFTGDTDGASVMDVQCRRPVGAF